jgi:uncharacterized Tic20 family protein
MDRILPIKIRLLAACCHLSGLSWIAIFYSILFLDSRSKFYPGSEIAGFMLALSPILVFVPLLTWLFTRNIHDFVDRSGRKALNYHLSVLLYITCLLFVMVISFGAVLLYIAMNASNILNPSPRPPVGTDEGNFFSSILTGLLWVASNPQYLSLIHAMNISIAVFFTLRGKVFSYPLAIPFFRSPRT